MGAARPARLAVGVVSAGRVGSVMGAAWAAAGHRVVATSGLSRASVRRAEALLPGVPLLPPDAVTGQADLVLLAVPDDVLPGLVRGLAAADGFRAGQIVVHTCGAHGIGVLGPAVDAGVLPLALHPVMTFTGRPEDVARLRGACFGVTAGSLAGPAIDTTGPLAGPHINAAGPLAGPDIGAATPDDEPAWNVGEALVLELGAEPVRIPEAVRPLYHAALAHGANHLVTLVRDCVDALAAAGVRPAERLVAPLLSAALDNALRHGDRALTGPVARGDTGTVRTHLQALAAVDPDLAAVYRAMAVRTAHRAAAAGLLPEHAAEDVLAVLRGPGA